MRTILITGTTSGFGLSLVKTFLENGDTVIASGRNIHTRSQIFDSLKKKYNSKLKLLDLDVTSALSRQNTENFLKDCPVDILINNAGVGHFGALEETTEENFRKVFEVNFFGLSLLTKLLLPNIRKKKGHIINISSMLGFAGLPLASAYSASKFALEGLSEALAHEVKPHGVKVTLIQPGGYRTNFSSNSIWDSKEESNYHTQVSGMKKFMAGLQSRKKFQKPEDLANGVLEITKLKNPKISYAFGKDSKFSRLLTKLTTRQAYFNITQKFYGKKLWRNFEKHL